MRVLIVDDHDDTGAAFDMLLSAAGHEVRAATTGRHALTIADSLDPELAIVDIHLPDTNGFVLARELRARTRTALQLVAITGSGNGRALSFAGVFDQFALKPVSAARLYQMIDAAQDHLRRGTAHRGSQMRSR